jgi:hypothetical protein
VLSVLQIGPSNQAADASAASFAQYMKSERHSVRCNAGHDAFLCKKLTTLSSTFFVWFPRLPNSIHDTRTIHYYDTFHLICIFVHSVTALH